MRGSLPQPSSTRRGVACRWSKLPPSCAAAGGVRCPRKSRFEIRSSLLGGSVTSSHKLVAGAVNGQEKPWLLRVGLQLLPQMHDVSVNCARGGELVIAPNVLQ